MKFWKVGSLRSSAVLTLLVLLTTLVSAPLIQVTASSNSKEKVSKKPREERRESFRIPKRKRKSVRKNLLEKLQEKSNNGKEKAKELSSKSSLSTTSGSIQASLTRTPSTVHSWQPAIIFAQVRGDFSNVSLTVNITVETVGPLDISIPSFSLPLVPMREGWYVTAIPGLLNITWTYSLITYSIGCDVSYSLQVDGTTEASGGYTVQSSTTTLKKPPIVFSLMHNITKKPSILKKTLGLGPEGWTADGREPTTTLLLALDDRGINQTTISFEYTINGTGWGSSSVKSDPLMETVQNLLQTINQEIIDTLNSLGLSLPSVKIPIGIYNATIPSQSAGSYVRFRANVTDVNGTTTTSPSGFYYTDKEDSVTRLLCIDPHVRQWILQKNTKQLIEKARSYSSYNLPAELTGNMTMFSKLSDIVDKYAVRPFHHWEYLGSNYNLYITTPTKDTTDLLQTQANGGFEPDVILLSSLGRGIRETPGNLWNWDLRDLNLQDDLIQYVKSQHAGVIATHGTLSDWKVWTSEKKYKIGARGHIGNSTADFDPTNETTIASLLGMPWLTLWEMVRDTIAEALSDPFKSIVGSIPLQIPYVPFNKSFDILPAGDGHPLLEGLSTGFDIPIPSLYQELGYKSYTEVGWQLAMPQALAYAAWRAANNTRDIAKEVVTKTGTLIENVTQGLVPSSNASRILDALKWGLQRFYRAVTSARINGSTFNLNISIPNVTDPVSISPEILYDKLLQMLPVNLLAISKKARAGITTYDKYWDTDGYRSVYFSPEIAACNNATVAKSLLTNAIAWTQNWQYKNITTLLDGIVRMGKDLAGNFTEMLQNISGTLACSKGLVAVQNGSNILEVSMSGSGVIHLLIAHPTSEKVNVTVQGNAEVSMKAQIMDHLTNVTMIVEAAGTIKVGISADPDASMNSIYVAAKKVEDTTPPSVEIQHPISVTYATSELDINATVSDAITSVATVLAEIDDSKNITLTPSDSLYSATHSFSDGEHTIRIYANDTVGNWNTTQTVTFTVDTTPPSVKVTSPSNHSVVAGTVNIQCYWSDLHPDTSILYEDGSKLTSWPTTGSKTYSWDTTGLQDGTYNITLWANDTLGRRNSTFIYLTVDNTNPTVRIDSPGNHTVVSGTVEVQIYWSDLHPETSILYKNGSELTRWTNMGSLTYAWDTTGLADGIYNISFWANDTVHNENSTWISLTVDNTAPSVSIQTPMNLANISSKTVNVTWVRSDNIALTSECSYSLDGGVWTNTTNNWHEFTGLEEGTHTVSILVYDKANNTVQKSISFTIDTYKPDFSYLTANETYFATTNPTIQWQALDNGTGVKIFQYRVDDGKWKNKTSANITLNLEEGKHNITVWTYDWMGHIRDPPLVFTVDTTTPCVRIDAPVNATLTSDTIDIQIYWEDASPEQILLYNNGTLMNATTVTGTQSFTWKTTLLADGVHNITLEGRDKAGNDNTTWIYLTVDNTKPTLSITSPEEGTVINTTGSISVEWSSNDATSGVSYYLVQLDDETWVNTTEKQYTFADVADGDHTVTVRSVDNVGNEVTATVTFEVIRDTDQDGMPDPWEEQYGLDPETANAGDDPDDDGLTNIEEYNNGTNPTKKDTDDDGMPDGWEVDNDLDPTADDAGNDPDNDGLTNLEEYEHKTDPHKADTDGDGVSDGKEVAVGTDPTDPGSKPIAGMHPMMFYGMIGAVVAVVAIAVAFYFLKVQKS